MRTACLVLIAAAVSACGPAHVAADPALAAYIDTLRAIDSHAHPMSFVPAGAPADTDYDALPLDGLPPFQLPAPLRASNPAYRDAQRSLYSLGGSDTGAAHVSAVEQARTTLIRQKADRFPEWVLDQLHIDVMLANRVAMGTGLASPRFRWVAFADPLMLPLDTRGEAARTPDTKSLYPLEATLLHRYKIGRAHV